jgi:uncharacterized membrane protein YphA (DoxX/SURF4 family)
MSERTKAIITIVITAVLNIANLYGFAVDAGAVVNAVLTVLSFICIAWSWWKNQNVTQEAQTAQIYLNKLKLEKKAVKFREQNDGK